LCVEVDKAHTKGKIFECTDSDIFTYKLFGYKVIRKAREGLTDKKIIWHKKGDVYKNRQGEYRSEKGKYRIDLRPSEIALAQIMSISMDENNTTGKEEK